MLAALLSAAALLVRAGDSAGMPGALVTVAQGASRQSRLTDAAGEARFRCREGEATVTLGPALPQGWTLAGDASRSVRTSLGPPARVSFEVRAARTLRGTAFLDLDGDQRLGAGEVPVPGVAVRAGAASATADAEGQFVLHGLESGEARVLGEGLLSGVAEVRMPPGPGEVRRDLPIAVRSALPDGWRLVPQPPASRAQADWARGKSLREVEISEHERLAALTNLDPAFRLVIAVGETADLAGALRGATALVRYLTGPGLVAPERIRLVLRNPNLARSGLLTLLLVRAEGGL